MARGYTPRQTLNIAKPININKLLLHVANLSRGSTSIPIGSAHDARFDYGFGPGVIPTQDTGTAVTNAVAQFLLSRAKNKQAEQSQAAVTPILRNYGLSDDQIGSIRESMDPDRFSSFANDLMIQDAMNRRNEEAKNIDKSWNPQEQELLRNFTINPSMETLNGMVNGMRPEKLGSLKAIIDLGDKYQLFPSELATKQANASLAGTKAGIAAQTRPDIVSKLASEAQLAGARAKNAPALFGAQAQNAVHQANLSGIKAQNEPMNESLGQSLKNAQLNKIQNDITQGAPGSRINLKNSKQIDSYLKGYRGQLENMAMQYPDANILYSHLSKAIPGLKPPVHPVETSGGDLMGGFGGNAQGSGKKVLQTYLKTQVQPALNNYIYDLSRQRYPVAAAITDQLRQHGYGALDEYNHPVADTKGGNIHIHKLDTETYPQFKQNMQNMFGRYLYVSPVGEDGVHSKGGMVHGVDGADFLIHGLDSEDVGQGK